jgi:hypothetical protein
MISRVNFLGMAHGQVYDEFMDGRAGIGRRDADDKRRFPDARR